jgi:hypothetical protein
MKSFVTVILIFVRLVPRHMTANTDISDQCKDYARAMDFLQAKYGKLQKQFDAETESVHRELTQVNVELDKIVKQMDVILMERERKISALEDELSKEHAFCIKSGTQRDGCVRQGHIKRVSRRATIERETHAVFDPIEEIGRVLKANGVDVIVKYKKRAEKILQDARLIMDMARAAMADRNNTCPHHPFEQKIQELYRKDIK